MESTLVQQSNKILVAPETTSKQKKTLPNKQTHNQIAPTEEKSTSKRNTTCGCLLITGAPYCTGSHINLP